MRIETTTIEGIVAITPPRFGDHRGYFSEVFKDAWFRENVADVTFIQDNESLSAEPGTVRGLHFQIPPFAQGKLVRCIAGRIMDVVVDIRTGSPSFGNWLSRGALAGKRHAALGAARLRAWIRHARAQQCHQLQGDRSLQPAA